MAEHQSYEKAGLLLQFLREMSANNSSLQNILNTLDRSGIHSYNDLFLVQPEQWEEILFLIREMDGSKVGKNTLVMQFKDLFYDFCLEEYNNEFQTQSNVLPLNDTYYWLFPSNQSIESRDDGPPQSGGKKRKTKRKGSKKKISKKTNKTKKRSKKRN